MSPLSQIYQRLPGQPYLVHNDAEGNDGVVGKTDNGGGVLEERKVCLKRNYLGFIYLSL